MKKYIALLMLSFCSIIAANAMSYEMAREQALYLTDKMAYELNLNDEQYDYCYEINLDYLMNITTADDVYGPWLTYRNADIRNILYDWQYSLFIAADYFFHPVYWRHGAWYYPIYSRYAATHFFFSHPRVYFDYRGGHSRLHFRNSFYVTRPHWNGGFRGMDRGAIQHRPVGGQVVGTRSRFGAANNGGLPGNTRGSVDGVRNRGGYDHPSSTRSMNSNIGGRDADVRIGNRSVNRGSSSTFSGGSSRGYHIGESAASTRESVSPSSTRSSSFGSGAASSRPSVGAGSVSRGGSFSGGAVSSRSASSAGTRSSIGAGSVSRSSSFGGSAASSRSSIGAGSVSRSSSFGGSAASSRSSVGAGSVSRSSSFGGGSMSSRSSAGGASSSRGGGFSGGSSSRGGGRGGR